MRVFNLIFLLTLTGTSLSAQHDLLAELEKENGNDTMFTIATFKGTRLINGQTVETKGRGELEFIFAHRFGKINDGLHELFGLDQAFVRIGLEYGLSDRLGVGMGRNSVDKTVDGYFRFKILRQSTGARNVPFTITAISAAAIRTTPLKKDAIYPIKFEDRLAYTSQLLIARKFSPGLSLQLMPTFMHRNTVEQNYEENKLYAMGFGGRIKLTKSMALSSEYYYRLNPNPNSPYHNVLGIGIDIETGGHIFQLVFTNTRGLTERAYIAETAGDLSRADVHFGFNVTRTF